MLNAASHFAHRNTFSHLVIMNSWQLKLMTAQQTTNMLFQHSKSCHGRRQEQQICFGNVFE